MNCQILFSRKRKLFKNAVCCNFYPTCKVLNELEQSISYNNSCSDESDQLTHLLLKRLEFLASHSVPCEDRSGCADVQADLRLRLASQGWAHMKSCRKFCTSAQI